jgi:hypothetical protein
MSGKPRAHEVIDRSAASSVGLLAARQRHRGHLRRAQQPVPVIGYLSSLPADTNPKFTQAFLEGVNDAGSSWGVAMRGGGRLSTQSLATCGDPSPLVEAHQLDAGVPGADLRPVGGRHGICLRGVRRVC